MQQATAQAAANEIPGFRLSLFVAATPPETLVETRAGLCERVGNQTAIASGSDLGIN